LCTFKLTMFFFLFSISFLPIGGQLSEDPRYTQRHLLLVYQQQKRINLGKFLLNFLLLQFEFHHGQETDPSKKVGELCNMYTMDMKERVANSRITSKKLWFPVVLLYQCTLQRTTIRISSKILRIRRENGMLIKKLFIERVAHD
jgi:hypothetical protein